MTSAPADDLLARVREGLSDEPTLLEKSMFGVRVLMVNDKIVVGVGKDGSLLVRVPAADHDELLTRGGASQAEMGAGRSMGQGWITVAAAGTDADHDLQSWLDVALANNHALTTSGD